MLLPPCNHGHPCMQIAVDSVAVATGTAQALQVLTPLVAALVTHLCVEGSKRLAKMSPNATRLISLIVGVLTTYGAAYAGAPTTNPVLGGLLAGALAIVGYHVRQSATTTTPPPTA